MHPLSSRLAASAAPRRRATLAGYLTGNASNSSPTVTKPTEAIQNDVLVVAIMSTDTGKSWTNASSFNEICDTGVGASIMVAHKICGASEPASWGFTSGAGGNSSWISLAFRGLDGNDFSVKASGTPVKSSGTGAVTLTLSSVTVAGIVPLLLAIVGNDSRITSGEAMGGGMTQLAKADYSNRPYLAAFSQDAEPGASSTRAWTATFGGTQYFGGLLFNIGR